jgi:hypothetical protein
MEESKNHIREKYKLLKVGASNKFWSFQFKQKDKKF